MVLPFVPENKGKYAAKGGGMGIYSYPNLESVSFAVNINTFEAAPFLIYSRFIILLYPSLILIIFGVN